MIEWLLMEKLALSKPDFCSFFPLLRSDGNPICQCGSCRHQICQHRPVLSYVQKGNALWIGRYITLFQHLIVLIFCKLQKQKCVNLGHPVHFLELTFDLLPERPKSLDTCFCEVSACHQTVVCGLFNEDAPLHGAL